MKNFFTPFIVDLPLDDIDLESLSALPRKKGTTPKVKILPAFDFFILKINGKSIKIDLGDSERLEQELKKGNSIEMEFSIGSKEEIKILFEWRGEQLAGGSKAMTMKVIENMKVEVKKAKPTPAQTKEIQKGINKIELHKIPFIGIQDVEVIKGSKRLKKIRNWYG